MKFWRSGREPEDVYGVGVVPIGGAPAVKTLASLVPTGRTGTDRQGGQMESRPTP
jgi:hypothetical protein